MKSDIRQAMELAIDQTNKEMELAIKNKTEFNQSTTYTKNYNIFLNKIQEGK